MQSIAPSEKDAATTRFLESWIWDAACSIRGAKDAPKYGNHLLLRSGIVDLAAFHASTS
ncbi:MAG: hypothetical protein ACI9VS_002073 [Candidatus Binatia bacterium]|jgi:hypothetical protein